MAEDQQQNQFAEIPLELRQNSDGWTVVCLDARGFAKHLAAVDSEIQAYRTARRMAEAYALRGDALVVAGGRYFYYEIDRLLAKAAKSHFQ